VVGATQVPLTQVLGFWHTVDVSQVQPMQLLTTLADVTRESGRWYAPPITSRRTTNPIWRKTSHARWAVRRVTALRALTTTGGRSRWFRRSRRLHRGWCRCTRWRTRFGRPNRAVSSVFSVYAPGQFPFYVLDDVVFVAVRVAVDGGKGVNHDVDVAWVLGYHPSSVM
jgi:hypothetical protein